MLNTTEALVAVAAKIYPKNNLVVQGVMYSETEPKPHVLLFSVSPKDDFFTSISMMVSAFCVMKKTRAFTITVEVRIATKTLDEPPDDDEIKRMNDDGELDAILVNFVYDGVKTEYVLTDHNGDTYDLPNNLPPALIVGPLKNFEDAVPGGRYYEVFEKRVAEFSDEEREENFKLWFGETIAGTTADIEHLVKKSSSRVH